MTTVRLIAASIAVLGAVACTPATAAKSDAPPAAAAAATAAPAATPAQSPRAFVDDLYGRYKNDPDFSPFAQQEQWFAPDLLAAMKEDERLTPEGEIGAIDADPICSCQDTSGMEAQVAGVEQTSPTTAVATVNLWVGTPDQRPLKLDLVAVSGQWRVHDIHGGGDDSFLAYVRKSNDEAKARAGH
jgi:hypothetical protein